jgi:hypothetical protein
MRHAGGYRQFRRRQAYADRLADLQAAFDGIASRGPF